MTEITGKIAEIAGHGLDVLNVEIFAVSGASGTLQVSFDVATPAPINSLVSSCATLCEVRALKACPARHDVVQPHDEEDTLLQQLQEQNTANSL